jgi:hypothetical protein
MIDAGHGKQLAHLLETNFRLATRNDGTDSFTTFDAPAFAKHLIGYSQALQQLGREVVAAYAGGIRDGFRLQKRAL